jgi:hypothetical protein
MLKGSPRLSAAAAAITAIQTLPPALELLQDNLIKLRPKSMGGPVHSPERKCSSIPSSSQSASHQRFSSERG